MALAVAAALFLGGAAAQAAAQGGPESARSTLSGAYTDAQARRGGEIYRKHCTDCHVPAAVTGVVFQRAWAGRTLYDYYELIRATMPNDNPGKLSRGQYADVVAYLLKLSGFPAGGRALPTDSAGLRRIRIEVEPSPSQ